MKKIKLSKDQFIDGKAQKADAVLEVNAQFADFLIGQELATAAE